MKVELGPHERLDDLCLDGMKIIQRDDEFCFSLDTVVLAHFGAVPKGHILDMGTGTAAIPLILAARGARQITAVELNPVMADIARRNIALNGKGHCITVKEGDYRHIREWVESGSLTPFTSIRRIGKRAAVPIAIWKASDGLVMKRRLPCRMS